LISYQCNLPKCLVYIVLYMTANRPVAVTDRQLAHRSNAVRFAIEISRPADLLGSFPHQPEGRQHSFSLQTDNPTGFHALEQPVQTTKSSRAHCTSFQSP